MNDKIHFLILIGINSTSSLLYQDLNVNSDNLKVAIGLQDQSSDNDLRSILKEILSKTFIFCLHQNKRIVDPNDVEHGVCLVVEALERVDEIDDISDDDNTNEDYTVDSTNHTEDNDSCVSEGTPEDDDNTYISEVEIINNEE